MKPLRNKRRSGGNEALSLLFWIGTVALLAFVLLQNVRVVKTVGISDEPTIHSGQTVVMDAWTYRFHAPQRGDMIVFIAPPMPTMWFVKRIIGIPGDTITINDAQVIVNGVTLNESYVSPALQGSNPNGNTYEHFTVPPNDYFVMGDDRRFSYDSRAWGFVPRQNIVGRIVAVLWPLAANSGYLPDEISVYRGV